MLEGKRIFIFEDDAFNLAVITVPLKRHGATIFFDRWGLDFRKALMRALPLDVILLDLMYPNGVTGYVIYDEIRSIPELETIPVIAVSAADPDVEMPKARGKGFAGFLGKPISNHFPKYVAQILDGKEIWEAE